MKILLVSHFFPPTRIGGAEKITQVYAANLQERGHNVQVLCAGDWEKGPLHWNGYVDEIYEGIPVRRVNFNWTKAHDPNRCLYDNPVVEAHLDGWLKSWKPDIVHIVSLVTLSTSVVRSAKKHSIPVVFTLVDFWLVCPKVSLVRGDYSLCDGKVNSGYCLQCLFWQSKYYRILSNILPGKVTERFLQRVSRTASISKIRGLRGMALNMDERKRMMVEICQQIDRVITPSAFLKTMVENVGLLSESTTLIPYGHDLSWVERMPEKKQSDSVRYGFIGQIAWLKGLHVLIPAFQAIATKYNAQLLIYGDPQSNPEYTSQLIRLVGENKDIKFMGIYAHAQIGEVLSGLDVIVVPSQWHENNPLVVQEAFASKTPVIGSKVGGIAEFIEHDINGLLFDHNSVKDLGVQMERVLTDNGLIKRLRNGIKPVKTITAEMDEVISIYHKLVSISDEP